MMLIRSHFHFVNDLISKFTQEFAHGSPQRKIIVITRVHNNIMMLIHSHFHSVNDLTSKCTQEFAHQSPNPTSTTRSNASWHQDQSSPS